MARITVDAVVELAKAYYAMPGNIAGGTLHALLIQKGVFTNEEYFEAVVQMAEHEASLLTTLTRQKCGLPDTVDFA